jgi:5'-nucleotidase
MRLRLAIVCFVGFLFLGGCSDTSAPSTDSSQPSPALTILVTNDDGIGAPGIDNMVNTLLELDGVEVRVVAPASNQSGSSDKTTEGEVVWEDSATISGYPGVAVYGFPADAVNVALETLGMDPDLVVSGVNQGQNVGPYARLSGTVGAARFAARAGYPATAASAGITAGADFAAAATLVVAWIEDHRAALVDDTASTGWVTSFNVPACTAGSIRGLVEVPLADSIPQGANVFFTDCSVEPDSAPTSDVDALVKGFAAVTQVPLEL